MTTIHQHPHPLAGQKLASSNPEMAQRYGKLHVIDWDDRVAGTTWQERRSRAGVFPEVVTYAMNRQELLTASVLENENAVVRTHSCSSGDLILMHTDWL
jgi:hypothetical protein